MNSNLSDLTGLPYYQQDNYTQPGSWHPKILADIPICRDQHPTVQWIVKLPTELHKLLMAGRSISGFPKTHKGPLPHLDIGNPNLRPNHSINSPDS